MKPTALAILAILFLCTMPLAGQYKFFDLKGENKAFVGAHVEMSADGRIIYMIDKRDFSYHTTLWELSGNTYQYKQDLETSM